VRTRVCARAAGSAPVTAYMCARCARVLGRTARLCGSRPLPCEPGWPREAGALGSRQPGRRAAQRTGAGPAFCRAERSRPRRRRRRKATPRPRASSHCPGALLRNGGCVGPSSHELRDGQKKKRFCCQKGKREISLFLSPDKKGNFWSSSFMCGRPTQERGMGNVQGAPGEVLEQLGLSRHSEASRCPLLPPPPCARPPARRAIIPCAACDDPRR